MALAVPAPPTRAAGSRITAAVYASDVTDSTTFLTNPPRFVGTQSIVQSLPNSAWTALALDTEQADEYLGHSTTSNTSRWVCPSGAAGWYTVCGVAAFAAAAAGFRASRIQIGGVAVPGAETYGPANGGAESVIITPTRDIQLAVGQYVEVAGWQSSGAALNTSVGGETRSALWLRYSHA